MVPVDLQAWFQLELLLHANLRFVRTDDKKKGANRSSHLQARFLAATGGARGQQSNTRAPAPSSSSSSSASAASNSNSASKAQFDPDAYMRALSQQLPEDEMKIGRAHV